jgi:hypothetical protein
MVYILKKLKRTKMHVDDLLCCYNAVHCPVDEYACPVWHSGLTKVQSDQLDII